MPEVTEVHNEDRFAFMESESDETKESRQRLLAGMEMVIFMERIQGFGGDGFP
jgi:hypothetical protein